MPVRYKIIMPDQSMVGGQLETQHRITMLWYNNNFNVDVDIWWPLKSWGPFKKYLSLTAFN